MPTTTPLLTPCDLKYDLPQQNLAPVETFPIVHVPLKSTIYASTFIHDPSLTPYCQPNQLSLLRGQQHVPFVYLVALALYILTPKHPPLGPILSYSQNQSSPIWGT